MDADVGMVVIGRHSDRTGERRWHVAGCAIAAALGLVLAAVYQNSVPLIVLSFTLSQLGQRAITWPLPLLEGVLTNSGLPSSSTTRSASIIAFNAKAVPVSRWHQRQ